MAGNHEVLEALHAAMATLETIRAERPDVIADSMPAGWGMNRLRAALANAPEASGGTTERVIGYISPSDLEVLVHEGRAMVWGTKGDKGLPLVLQSPALTGEPA